MQKFRLASDDEYEDDEFIQDEDATPNDYVITPNVQYGRKQRNTGAEDRNDVEQLLRTATAEQIDVLK